MHIEKRATATFHVDFWEEKTFDEIDTNLKLTRASLKCTYQGGIVGVGTAEYLLTYRVDGTVSFVALEHLVGTIGGRSGNAVFQHAGTLVEGKMRSNWFLVPGGSSGELHHVRCQGDYITARGEPGEVSFMYLL